MNPINKYLLPFLLILLPFGKLASQNCTGPDCVWPGDANKNGVVNHLDMLWIGLAMGTQNGINQFERPNATITWTPQTAPDWGQTFSNSGVNFKHADVDGNAFIDGSDFFALNDFNLIDSTNSNFSGSLGNDFTGNDLIIVPSNPNPQPGETVRLSIQLGDAQNVIDSIYGIAYTLEYDTAYIQEDLTMVAPSGNWMGTMPTNLFNYEKHSKGTSSEMAHCRIDGNTASGFGEIAAVDIVIEDVILGRVINNPDSAILNIKIKQVLGIGNREQDLLLTNTSLSLNIETDTTSSNSPTQTVTTEPVTIYPNPASEAITIKMNDASQMKAVAIYNSSGSQIENRQRINTPIVQIPTTDFAAGIYFLKIKTNEKTIVKKITLLTH